MEEEVGGEVEEELGGEVDMGGRVEEKEVERGRKKTWKEGKAGRGRRKRRKRKEKEVEEGGIRGEARRKRK